MKNVKELEFNSLIGELKELENIEVSKRKDFVCDYLNNLSGKKGFIYKNYSVGGTKGNKFERQYFSDENALKCDSIRIKIENWKKEQKVNENEYYFLLASLLEATDKVANTASVYGAFLKKLKKSALKPLNLKPVELFINDHNHDIFNENINNLITKTIILK